MNETRELASFAAGLSFDRLPQDVVERAKERLLDTLGCGLWGSTLPWGKMAAALAQEANSTQISTVLGQSWKTTPQYAALVNGTMSHGFELDDLHRRAGGHIGSVVVPAVLAMAEREHANGKALLTAVAIGYEIQGRVGRAVNIGASAHIVHTPCANGVFGAAAAAGWLLGFNEEQMVNAFGIAGSLAGGLMEFSQDSAGGMVKRLHAGRAAEGGIIAALLAARGFTGPSTVIEGKFGYLRAYSHDPNPSALTKDLGKDFELRYIGTKAFAACGTIHAPVSAMLELMQRYGIRGEEVARIEVGVREKGAEQNALPEPRSAMAAQYSIPFNIGLTLYRDIHDPSIYSEANMNDAQILDIAHRVVVYRAKELETSPREMHGSKVAVHLKDGRDFATTMIDFKGSEENPVTPEEIVAKFRKLAKAALDPAQVETVIKKVAAMEKVPDIRELCEHLQGKIAVH